MDDRRSDVVSDLCFDYCHLLRVFVAAYRDCASAIVDYTTVLR